MPLNQVINGNFQDIRGNPLANGYILIELNQDSSTSDSSGNTLVCSNYIVKISLNAEGNIPSSPAQSLWINTSLNVEDTFYTISVYSANGQLVWGPYQQTVPSSPSPFDIGTWIPGNV